jgi:hypothetical protein
VDWKETLITLAVCGLIFSLVMTALDCHQEQKRIERIEKYNHKKRGEPNADK